MDFTCQMTDMSSVRPLFEESRSETPASLKNFFDGYSVTLRDGARREESGKIILHTANSKGYWHIVSLGDLLGPAFSAWPRSMNGREMPRLPKPRR